MTTVRVNRMKKRKIHPDGRIGRGSPTPSAGGKARAKAIAEGRIALCGAFTKNETYCRHIAGYGTTHKGEGRCKFHGGAIAAHKKGAALDKAEKKVAKLAPAVAEEEVNTVTGMRELLRN